MLGLVAIIVFGILIALFATQNTNATDITLANYCLSGVPVFGIALGGLLLGVLVSWVLSLVGAISSSLTIHGKDSKINDLRKTLNDQQRKIRDLEVENARLQEKRDVDRPRLSILRKPRDERV